MTGTKVPKEIQWRGEFPKSLIPFILEHADEGVWYVDKHNRISAVNPKGAAIVGFLPDEMIGHSTVEFLTFSGEPVSGGKQVDKNGAHTMHKVLCKDGSSSIVVSRTVPLIGTDGVYSGAVIYFVNVSEANSWAQADQKAEEHLDRVRSERELLIDIITRMPYEVVLMDSEGKFLFINDAAAASLQKRPDEVLGKRCVEAGFDESFCSEIECSVLRVFSSAEMVQGEMEFPSQEGTRLKSFSMTPVSGPDGSVLVALMVSRDISHSVLVREEPGPAQDGDGHNGSMVDNLQKSLGEVYTCLTAIQRQCQESAGSGDDTGIRESVIGVQRMQALLQDILLYSEQGKGECGGEEVKSSDVLADVERELSAEINENDVSVVSGNLPVLWMDRSHIRHIFSNLIRHAISAKGPERLVIRISAKRTGHSWQFSVKDNGLGINPVYAGRVFDLPDESGVSQPGVEHMVRLAVCKKLIERNGGRIWVDSIPGQGSTFYFTIPLEGYQAAHQSVDIAHP